LGTIIALPKSLLTCVHVLDEKIKPLHPTVLEQLDAHVFAVVLVESIVITRLEFGAGVEFAIL
jgi:hypothetical protein